MSSLAKTDLLPEGAAQRVKEYMADTAEGQVRRPVHERLTDADLAAIEARVLASMTPAEVAAAYARRGYRRVSRRHCRIARVDREDWLCVLAAHLGKSTAELCRVVEARNPVGYAITNEVSDAWADYYRRVLSEDAVTVPEEVMFLVPTSDHDPVAYVGKPGAGQEEGRCPPLTSTSPGARSSAPPTPTRPWQSARAARSTGASCGRRGPAGARAPPASATASRASATGATGAAP